MNKAWLSPTDGGASAMDTGNDSPIESSSRNEDHNLNGPDGSMPCVYYAMVIDSGPIIKQDVSALFTTNHTAQTYFTVPGVMAEIRDSKTRKYLTSTSLSYWLDRLHVREPTKESMQAVIEFAKETGDYPSLSAVDLQVLALTYELEHEGCRDTAHIRTKPKRTIGLGTIRLLNGGNSSQKNKEILLADSNSSKERENDADTQIEISSTGTAIAATPLNLEYDIVEEDEDDADDDHEDDDQEDEEEGQQQQQSEDAANVLVLEETRDEVEKSVATPKSWATLVNPNATNVSASASSISATSNASKAARSVHRLLDDTLHGQFDDASSSCDQDESISVDVLELESDFPSLQEAVTVEPNPGEDDDTSDDRNEVTTEEGEDQNRIDCIHSTSLFERSDEEKKRNLQPISKSGKLYNSFRKYSDLMKPNRIAKSKHYVQIHEKETRKEDAKLQSTTNQGLSTNHDDLSTNHDHAISTAIPTESRILHTGASSMMSETMNVEDDDGEGWITSMKDIQTTVTQGKLTVSTSHNHNNHQIGNVLEPSNESTNTGPPLSQRTACVTTDFAMQNVLLQMNLILVSVQGMQIRRLKSWVIRCGACYKIHSAANDDDTFLGGRIQRLFCSHCGSDMLQRIAASVDGKSGRLKLHFSHKRKQGRHMSKRGTKFSLPKAGKGNKYQGDLLLREDQLLMGAWNQKVKIRAGKTYQRSHSESIFGRDLASTVGCNVVTKHASPTANAIGFGSSSWTSTTSRLSSGGAPTASALDIRVGFGPRTNPNAAKGRERRGKKKKSSDRACGMRRY